MASRSEQSGVTSPSRAAERLQLVLGAVGRVDTLSLPVQSREQRWKMQILAWPAHGDFQVRQSTHACHQGWNIRGDNRQI
jgi:hypothetical protein